MNIILDVILIAIFAAIVFAAVKKGFMLSLLELVAVIAALVLAFQLSPVVSQAAYDGVVEKSLIETVETQIDETLNLSETGTQAEVILNAIPGFMVDFASSAGIEVEEIKAKISSENFSSENLATELVTKVAQPIVVGALTVVFFLLLAGVLLFLFKWLAQILSKLFKLPLIGTANKALGGVLGACKGIMVIVFISTILELIFAGGENEISSAINNSYVIGLLDNVNPFLNSLKEIF